MKLYSVAFIVLACCVSLGHGEGISALGTNASGALSEIPALKTTSGEHRAYARHSITNKEQALDILDRKIKGIETRLADPHVSEATRTSQAGMLERLRLLREQTATNSFEPFLQAQKNLQGSAVSNGAVRNFPTNPFSIPQRELMVKSVPARAVRPPESLPDTNLAAMAAQLKVNPRSSVTNGPDFPSYTMSEMITRLEGQLQNPNLDTNNRALLENRLQDRKEKLGESERNAQLWANVNRAYQSRDHAESVHAEQELADFMAARLGRVEGKTYPQGMSLEAVMQLYKARTGYKEPGKSQ